MRSAYERAVLDIGTGDGRFVLKTAAFRPDCLVVGLDANAAAMAEASRRTAAKASRGGLPNALFVVAAAEALPDELSGAFDEVTVHFPWGSLLRGLVSADDVLLAGLTRVMADGACLRVLLSITEREAATGVEPMSLERIDSLRWAYSRHGLELVDAGLAEDGAIQASHSTWGKRLGPGREVWSLTFRLRESGP